MKKELDDPPKGENQIIKKKKLPYINIHYGLRMKRQKNKGKK
jgi:hypothetical protein